jgi:hypothetical protein
MLTDSGNAECPVKVLKGFPHSYQTIGFLRDGTLYADRHLFDEIRGDSASTDYFCARDVGRLKAFLCRLGLKAEGDAELLDALAERFDTALEVGMALHALGFHPVNILDIDAQYSRADVMPTAA